MKAITKERVQEHVRATGWVIFVLSWLCDPIYVTRWLRGN